MRFIPLMIWFSLFGMTMAALPVQGMLQEDSVHSESPKKSGMEDTEELKWEEGLKVFNEQIPGLSAPLNFEENLKTFSRKPGPTRIAAPPTPPPEKC